MNRTKKPAKLKLESGENWVTLLPFALLRVRCTPFRKGLTTFEIMFRGPPPLMPNLEEDEVAFIRDLLKSFQALQKATTSAQRVVQETYQKTDHLEERGVS